MSIIVCVCGWKRSWVISFDDVFVFGQSCFDFLRCFSDAFFVAILSGEHINGVALVWDAGEILMFSEVGCKFV